ncbi:MAG: sulfatase-like hydrolase/transferase [Candidatus Sumerlaeota bacterium]|nr:sulfatase-like hydrolase/transferase [Candidatus Sumerlaeota bacterium]
MPMPTSSSDRPNAILFFTDQQRWDTMGLHGNPMDLTPNLDRMAQRGTFLANAFTNQPLCGPARACLLTGQYATAVGCWKNQIALPREAHTLARCFQEAGYETGFIGKWHLAGHCENEIVPADLRGGYDYWLGANTIEFTSELYRTLVYDNDNRPARLPGYRVDALTDAAIRFIDARRERPFHLFLSFSAPHHHNRLDDYPPPDGYRERYTRNCWIPPDLAALGGSAHQHLPGYYGMVKRLDEALGRLLDALKSLDLLDKTIVLFASDHGCHFRTRNSEYKRSCHESSLRVPMAAQGPGFQGGGWVAQLVSLVDVAPTLLDAAGLPIPPSAQGRSFLPLLRGETIDWPEEVFAQITESQTGRCIRTRRWKYGIDAPDEGRPRQASAARYVEQYLYDLECDPYELANLAGLSSHREASDILRDRLIRRMVEAGEEAPTIEPAPPRPAGGQRRVYPNEARQ